jgi:hypothetical protein
MQRQPELFQHLSGALSRPLRPTLRGTVRHVLALLPRLHHCCSGIGVSMLDLDRRIGQRFAQCAADLLRLLSIESKLMAATSPVAGFPNNHVHAVLHR